MDDETRAVIYAHYQLDRQAVCRHCNRAIYFNAIVPEIRDFVRPKADTWHHIGSDDLLVRGCRAAEPHAEKVIVGELSGV